MIVSGVRFVPGRNDYSDRDGRKYGVAIHNTANTASAAGEAAYAQRRTDGVSAHFYVDDVEVIQSIDTKHRTGHAGSTAGNEHAVSVEITGTNARSRQWWLDNVAWNQLARVLAQVCHRYGIEPRRASVAEMKANPQVRAFYSHDDMRRAWGGTTHTDPGPNFPWDHLLAKVRQAMTQEDDVSAADVWQGTKWKGTDGREYEAGTWLRNANVYAGKAMLEAQAVRVELAALRQVVQTLADAVKAGGGSVDTAAILAGVDERLAVVRKQVADELASRLAS